MKNNTTGAEEILHWPGRENCLESMDDHLHKTARLARVLWETVANEDIDTTDPRTRMALEELASIVADHASAAAFVYDRDSSGRG